MSAKTEYHIRVFDGTGRPPRVDRYTEHPLEIMEVILHELGDPAFHKIDLERRES